MSIISGLSGDSLPAAVMSASTTLSLCMNFMAASAPRWMFSSVELSAAKHASSALSLRRVWVAMCGRMMEEFGVEWIFSILPACDGSGERETMNFAEPLGSVSMPVALNVTALAGIL